MLGSGLTLLGTVAAWLAKGKLGGAASSCSPEAFRARAVAAALSEVGKANLDKYFADAAPQFVGAKPEWCGIFDLWALHQAGLGKGVQWRTALGFLEVNHTPGPGKLTRTTNPQPGDIAYVAVPYRHHAMVREVRGTEVDLINGNGAGGVVSLSTSSFDKITTFYSIQRWVDVAVKECSK